jgi:hypothetical protein
VDSGISEWACSLGVCGDIMLHINCTIILNSRWVTPMIYDCKAHVYGWVVQQRGGAHVDAHDEVLIVWCTCIWAYDAYAYELMVHMHSERCTWCVLDVVHARWCICWWTSDAYAYEVWCSWCNVSMTFFTHEVSQGREDKHRVEE